MAKEKKYGYGEVAGVRVRFISSETHMRHITGTDAHNMKHIWNEAQHPGRLQCFPPICTEIKPELKGDIRILSHIGACKDAKAKFECLLWLEDGSRRAKAPKHRLGECPFSRYEGMEEFKSEPGK